MVLMISRDTLSWYGRSLAPEFLLLFSVGILWGTRHVWQDLSLFSTEAFEKGVLAFYLPMVGVAGHLLWRCFRLIQRARIGRDFGEIANAVLYPLLFVFFFGIFLATLLKSPP